MSYLCWVLMIAVLGFVFFFFSEGGEVLLFLAFSNTS